MISYLQSAFVPIAAYPASQAPHWKIGAKLYLAFACMAIFIFVGIWYALRWEERRAEKGKGMRGAQSEEGSLGEVEVEP